MSLKSLVLDTYNAFLQHSTAVQVVLLHPHSRLRSMLVAYLLNESPAPVFYYALSADDVNLSAFLDGFTHDMTVQKPTFGRHLYRIWNDAKASISEMVEAFQNDLAELHDEKYLLILDEFDTSRNADDVQTFWEHVVRTLPPQCQLVINSRTLPRISWVSLIARKQAVILRDSEHIIENFYRVANENPMTTLNAFGLGPGYVHQGEDTIEDWEGHLPRLLFFYVLSRPFATRSEICTTFWPNLDGDQTVNVFHVTKRRLHKALGFDALVHEDGYYQISPEFQVEYDVENFVTALIKGRQAATFAEGIEYWQTAIDLYRGPFLQGHTDDWIVEQRADLQIGYLEAVTSIARVRIEEGRKEQALAILLRASNDYDSYEPIHWEIMELYASLGRRSEAAGHYQKLVETLQSQGAEPSPETRAVYHRIMS